MAVSTLQTYPLPRGATVRLALIGLVIVIPALVMIGLDRPQLALLPFLAAGFVWFLTTPRLSLYLFIASLGLYLPYHTGYFAIHLMDVALGMLFLGVILEFLLRGHTEIRATGFDRVFGALILATILSAIFAHNYRLSIVPVVRIMTLYIAFRMLFKYATEISIRRLIEYYLLLVFALSVISAVELALTRGSLRIFGPAVLAMQYFTMTALPMVLCLFVWEARPLHRWRYATYACFYAVAMLATQSRAPMVATVIAMPVLIGVLYAKLRTERDSMAWRNLKRIFAVAALVAVVTIILSGTLFAGAFARVAEFLASFKTPKGTIALRLVLWSAALEAFVRHPILGIGIGNFRVVDEVLPHLKFAPTWRWVRGMSAHNVVLHYLAETGLVGTLSLLALAVSGFRTARRNLRESVSRQEAPIVTAMFMAMFVFCVTLLYMRAWTWEQGGYLMALIFALHAAWRYRRRAVDRSAQGQPNGHGRAATDLAGN